jgi:hypothetical protein
MSLQLDEKMISFRSEVQAICSNSQAAGVRAFSRPPVPGIA